MKKQLLFNIWICIVALGVLHSCASKKNSSINQMVIRMEIKEDIKDLCDKNNVFVILALPGNGQVKAIAPKTNIEITELLNSKVDFLKDKPNYEDKGMIKLIVNCKGKLVNCKMDNNTQSTELDAQIVEVFSELVNWTPGSIHKKEVDTAELYSFTISEGKITLKK